MNIDRAREYTAVSGRQIQLQRHINTTQHKYWLFCFSAVFCLNRRLRVCESPHTSRAAVRDVRCACAQWKCGGDARACAHLCVAFGRSGAKVKPYITGLEVSCSRTATQARQSEETAGGGAVSQERTMSTLRCKIRAASVTHVAQLIG